MIEKHITIEDVPLAELFGAEHGHFRKIQSAFPDAKLFSRGNKLVIQGNTLSVKRVFGLFEHLITHCRREGELTEVQLARFLEGDNVRVSDSEGPSAYLSILRSVDGKSIVPLTRNQHRLCALFSKHSLCFVVGSSGTGKTFLSVAWALSSLRRKEVDRVIITRPAVEAGEHLGFLPGEMEEKMSPYVQPIYDALAQMLSNERLQFYKEKGIIQVLPLAYMRGRTLSKACIILDEAQNTTILQMKMFLTRMGEGSRVIVTGDLSQIDLPSTTSSGLVDAMARFREISGVGCMALGKEDVLRHPLVKRIIAAYDGDKDTD